MDIGRERAIANQPMIEELKNSLPILGEGYSVQDLMNDDKDYLGLHSGSCNSS